VVCSAPLPPLSSGCTVLAWFLTVMMLARECRGIAPMWLLDVGIGGAGAGAAGAIFTVHPKEAMPRARRAPMVGS
jgi:hypothetical protein